MPTLECFKNKTNHLLPGYAPQEVIAQREYLFSTFGLSANQVVEAASYSMAMVVRYALGLSAQGGSICALVRDCLSGWVALATARHLINAGANAHIIFVQPQGEQGSNELNSQLLPLENLGANFHAWNDASDNTEIERLLTQSHNALLGLFDFKQALGSVAALIEMVNEQRTPIHSIDCPIGLNPENGVAEAATLVASSTLSLGAPLSCLQHADNFVGRHYLCDISIPAQHYQVDSQTAATLFAEQPVIQIFPVKNEEEN